MSYPGADQPLPGGHMERAESPFSPIVTRGANREYASAAARPQIRDGFQVVSDAQQPDAIKPGFHDWNGSWNGTANEPKHANGELAYTMGDPKQFIKDIKEQLAKQLSALDPAHPISPDQLSQKDIKNYLDQIMKANPGATFKPGEDIVIPPYQRPPGQTEAPPPPREPHAEAPPPPGPQDATHPTEQPPSPGEGHGHRGRGRRGRRGHEGQGERDPRHHKGRRAAPEPTDSPEETRTAPPAEDPPPSSPLDADLRKVPPEATKTPNKDVVTEDASKGVTSHYMDGHLTSQTSAAGTFEFGYKDGQVVSVKVSNGQGIDGGQWLRQQNGQFVSPDGTKTATGAVDANGVFKLTLNPSPS